MLEKIFQTIEEKSAVEINKILKEKEVAVLTLERNYQKDAEEKKMVAKSALQRRVDEKIEEFKQLKAQELTFKLQEEKNKLIDSVYEAGQEAIAGMAESGFERWVESLTSFVPDSGSGEIVAGERTAKILKRLLRGKKLPINDGLPEEGFIFRSLAFEIDARLSQLAKEKREKTEPQITKMLFA